MAELCMRVETNLNNVEKEKYYMCSTSIVILLTSEVKQSKLIKNSIAEITAL